MYVAFCIEISVVAAWPRSFSKFQKQDRKKVLKAIGWLVVNIAIVLFRSRDRMVIVVPLTKAFAVAAATAATTRLSPQLSLVLRAAVIVSLLSHGKNNIFLFYKIYSNVTNSLISELLKPI